MNANTSLLRLGTSSWSCRDWVGKFYEPGTPPGNFIAAYARRFDTVEIDSTFYAIPRRSVVEGWRDRTPEHFLFSAKAPQVITHEKFLRNCEAELRAFLDTMAILGPRLGPIVLQFPYFAKRSGITGERFLSELERFLPLLPREHSWVVEVRNRAWLDDALLALLRRFKVSLALIDHPWMPGPDVLFDRPGILTGEFAYIRWLGDRHGIEKRTTTWNETIVDRQSDLERWARRIKSLLAQRFPVLGYVNNHYSGYAPEAVERLKGQLQPDVDRAGGQA